MVKQKLKKGGSGMGGVQQPVIQPLGQKALDPSSPSSNIGVLVFIGPYILISFFLLLSIFNSNLKGLMYVFGVIFLTPIVLALSKLILPNENMKPFNFFGDLLNDIPTFSSSLYSYTFFYLLAAMIGSNIINMGLVVFILLMAAADAGIRLRYKSTTQKGIFFGFIIGAIVGMIWYIVMSQAGPKFLYFEEYVSNKVACGVPKKQGFKCRLYKNGVEIDFANSGVEIPSDGGPGDEHVHNIIP